MHILSDTRARKNAIRDLVHKLMKPGVQTDTSWDQWCDALAAIDIDDIREAINAHQRTDRSPREF